MTAPSVLFAAAMPPDVEGGCQPSYFADLNLDQVSAAVTSGRDPHRIAPFFYYPLTDVDEVRYRQEVFQDLQHDPVRDVATAFTQQSLVTAYLYRTHEMATEHRDVGHYHRARLFLNSAAGYCDAVTALATGLARVGVRSRGLRRLHAYLSDHVRSEVFTALQTENRRLREALDTVRYCVVVKGDRVTVGHYGEEIDYSQQVVETFQRFQQDAATDYRDLRPNWREEEFVELAILDMVAKLYPELFGALDAFCDRYRSYLDPVVAAADREFHFYLSYLDYISPLRAAGLTLSYPRMSTDRKQEQALDTFDLALAAHLVGRGDRVITNDITLRGAERILVISGPNNGGKTTMARTFGQLHHLARLGCPVPGRDVQLFCCDQIFTHFEWQEDVTTLAGKLQEELDRLHTTLIRATSASVLVLNEVFNSTTAADASFLSRMILQRIAELDALAVCVTFLDELSTLSKTVSMVSQVAPDDPAIRTHKVIRARADGRAYARAIAEKYGLTYRQVIAERSLP